MSTTKIDLKKYRVPGSKVFTGRDRGRQVRTDSKIDESIHKYENVVIVVPEDIYSINPSFLEEFFYNVVTKLGKAEFRRRFSFDNKGEYNITQDLDEAIDRILRQGSSLI